MRVAVTGATGLVGANVVRSLLARGYDVRVGVRSGSSTKGLDGLAIEKVPFSLDDRASLERGFAGCDGVIHCAGSVWVGATRMEESHQTNVVGTDNVCAAAVANHVQRLVHVSTTSCCGMRADNLPANEDVPFDPKQYFETPYSTTKFAAEQAVQTYVKGGLNAAIVCPALMFGPWDSKPSSGRLIQEIASGKALVAPAGVNDVCDVRDVADAMVTALEKGQPGRRYILGGRGMSWADLWSLIARKVGGRGPLFTAPDFMTLGVGRMASLYGRVRGEEPEVNLVAARFSTFRGFWFDSSRAKAELGYPDSDPEKAIADAWQWFREHGYA